MQIARVAALVARRRREGQSLRDLAREIGVSKSTIDSLVQAHDRLRPMPQPHVTWPRLRKWYMDARPPAEGGTEEPDDMALVAGQLLADIPAAVRPAATGELLGLVGVVYDQFDSPRPDWLRRLLTADPPEEPGSA
ncbi:MAG: helix-turn-helix domain-containing protein [Longimicrobiaceae bacterium]